MRISIAVCTAGRPELLRACLESIIAQEGPAGSELRLIVVDNNQLPDAEPIAAEIAGKGRFPVHYVHESRLGIPFARNRAIDTALALKSDWIAFIDDDHEATPGWLVGADPGGAKASGRRGPGPADQALSRIGFPSSP